MLCPRIRLRSLLPEEELYTTDGHLPNRKVLEVGQHKHAQLTLIGVLRALGTVDIEHHVLHPRGREQRKW